MYWIAWNFHLSYCDRTENWDFSRKPRQNSGPFILLRFFSGKNPISHLAAQFYTVTITMAFFLCFNITNTSFFAEILIPNCMFFFFRILPRGFSHGDPGSLNDWRGHLLATLQMKLKDLDEEVKAISPWGHSGGSDALMKKIQWSSPNRFP